MPLNGDEMDYNLSMAIIAATPACMLKAREKFFNILLVINLILLVESFYHFDFILASLLAESKIMINQIVFVLILFLFFFIQRSYQFLN